MNSASTPSMGMEPLRIADGVRMLSDRDLERDFSSQRSLLFE